jgi:hypothetical protein
MIAAMVEETAEAKLKRHEDALVACMAEITRLREENARLRSSENTAHSVLREVYNDPSASPHVRVLAAKAAISHESAPLKAVPPPMELVAEPYEDLATVVTRQRARAAALLPKLIEQTKKDNEAAVLAQRARMNRDWRNGGNSGGDNTES